MSKVYLNSVGVEIKLDCGVDISGSSSYAIGYFKPDGSTGLWNATISGSSYLTYTTTAGALNVPGEYKVQALITWSTFSGLGETASFNVYNYFG